MAFPIPPIHAGEITPRKTAAVNQRVQAQEVPVLPEPRTYYVKNTNAVVTSGTARFTVLSVPIFWRPGNTVSVMFKNDFTCSGAMQVNYTMDGGPYGNGAAIPIIASFTPSVFPTFSTVVTQHDGSAKIMSVLNPFAIQPQLWVPYAGQTGNATAPDEYTLDFKVARTSGAANFTSTTAEAWVMVL